MTTSDFVEPPLDGPTVRSTSDSWPRRLRRALVILALFLAVPLALAGWLAGREAAFACTLGAIIALSSAMTNGRRATRYALPLMVLALIAGALTKPVLGHADQAPLDGWLWVLVVMAFAIGSGLATRYGVGVAVATATVYAVIAPPVRDGHTLAVEVGFLLVGSLYGWLLAARLGAESASPAPPASVRSSRLIALFLGVATGLACALVVIFQFPHSVWVATAVVVLGIPTPGFTEGAIVKRMIGQLGACAIVGAVTWAITSFGEAHASVLFAVATLLCALGYLMMIGRPLEQQIAFLSAAIMMPVAAKEAHELGWVVGDRLIYNLVGLGILAVALVAVRLWATERPGLPAPG